MALRADVVFTLGKLGIFFMLLLSSADFFSNLTFSKYSFRNTIRVSNYLDPDQDRHFVGPDLGSNCLQRLSAEDKSKHSFDCVLFCSNRLEYEARG